MNFLLRSIRFIYNKIKSSQKDDIHGSYDEDLITYKGQMASDLIMSYIIKGTPFVVGRLGIELHTMLNYKELHYTGFEKSIRFIKNKIHFQSWSNDNISNLCMHAGFFPEKVVEVEKFSKLMINEMKQVDIWGAFSKIEYQFKDELKNSIKIKLSDIEPFLHEIPWTSILEGKKVLVIHPFEDSIKSQYKKRRLLFTNKTMLPNFELKTLKAVQSIGKTKTQFIDWFEALEYMKKEISAIDFDIAIVGCGAYSLPLSTFIKSIGRSAVYMGGGTQILFGIKGKRWEDYQPIASLFNNHWVRPSEKEKVSNSHQIEKGCYW